MARPRTVDRVLIASLRGTMSSREVEAAHGIKAATVRCVWSRERLHRMRRLFGAGVEIVAEPDAFTAVAADAGRGRDEIVTEVLTVLAAEPTLIRNLLDLPETGRAP